MGQTLLARAASVHPLVPLALIFWTWKALLLLVAFSSPGIGYDTSTTLLSLRDDETSLFGTCPLEVQQIWLKLVRWDAIYYTQAAERWHVFEQEWAFGIGLSSVIGSIHQVVSKLTPHLTTATIGIIVSHISHWFSVVLLWHIVEIIQPHDRSIAVTASALHIFSPAGIFLSAPQSESLFSYANMLGYFLYISSVNLSQKNRTALSSIGFIAAGVILGFGTMVRSNGILSGVPFLYDAFTVSFGIIRNGLSLQRLITLASIIAGGLLLGAGLVIPQYIAYQEYCVNSTLDYSTPWCNHTVPLIYSWVQSHYWNVGLFRSWTLSNLPLFLLALPTLWIMTISSLDTFRLPEQNEKSKNTPLRLDLAKRLALPQLILAIAAFTSYHVQIVTRLSSGYPIWYIWLAQKIKDKDQTAGVVSYWAIIYALVQAGLYASFLPPA